MFYVVCSSKALQQLTIGCYREQTNKFQVDVRQKAHFTITQLSAVSVCVYTLFKRADAAREAIITTLASQPKTRISISKQKVQIRQPAN